MAGESPVISLATARHWREQGRQLLKGEKFGQTDETLREDLVRMAEHYISGNGDFHS